MVFGGTSLARPNALRRSAARGAGLLALAGLWFSPAFIGGASLRPSARSGVATRAIPTLRPLKIQKQNRKLSDWKPQMSLPEPNVPQQPGEPILRQRHGGPHRRPAEVQRLHPLQG